jgi:hypothetical protein
LIQQATGTPLRPAVLARDIARDTAR